jgi:hypothetical protein
MWGTIAGYTTLFVVGAALTYYYNPGLFKSAASQISSRETPEIRTQSKKNKQKRVKKSEEDSKTISAQVSSSEVQASKKRKIVSAPKGDVVAKTQEGTKASLPRVEDDDIDNAAFAQQLKQAQQGTKLQKPQQASNQKERRAAKPVTKPESPTLSAETSSTAGRDGDDDMSPSDTPASSVSRAGDVSDMLEATPAKPNTIRLTSTDTAKPTKTAPKQFETVLTKKQRQRRQKQEENRLLREEADKEHEAKKQQQLRTARMAAGTSNQTKANNFTQTQNAWKSSNTNAQPVQQPPTQSGLLDTFEPSETPKESVSTKPAEQVTQDSGTSVAEAKEEVGKDKVEALAASKREGRPGIAQQPSWADEVNADDQDKWMKQLTGAGEEEWEDVTSKKQKKKNRKNANDTSSEGSRPPPASTATVAPKITSAAQTKEPPSNYQNRFLSVQGDEWEA